MDFHGLPRRQLQALCKMNKIPANITNVAMADALKALPTVQGIEELFLKPSETSAESPGKSQVASLVSVPRTGGRGTTTTRRQKITMQEDESENLQTLTGTRRSTRRLATAGGDKKIAQTPAAPPSVCRKMETQFNEIEDEDKIGKEKENFSQTPALVPASRQRGLKHTYGYSTRRSARLAEKNMEDLNTIKGEERSETEKKELFSSNDFGEILEMNVKEGCPAESLPVTESSVAGVDLKEKSEQGFDNSYLAEVVSGTKSDPSMENQNNFQICGFDEDAGENFEIGESKMKTKCDGGGEGDRCDNEPNELYINKTVDTFENGEELDANEEMGSNDVAAKDVAEVTHHSKYTVDQINEEMGSNDVAAEDVAEVIQHNDVLSNENTNDHKMKSEEELLESNKDSGLSNDMNASFEGGRRLNEQKEIMESEDGSAQNLMDDEKDTGSEDLDVLKINDGVVETNESGEYESSDPFLPKSEVQVVGITPALESMVESGASAEEAFADSLAGKFMAIELNTSASEEHKTSACLEEMSWVEDADFQVVPIAEEQCEKSISGENVANLVIKDDGVLDEEQGLKNYDFVLDFDESSTKQQGAIDVVTGDITVLPCLTADSNETLADYVVPTGSLTPIKESTNPRKIPTPQKKFVSKKTPTAAAAKRMMMTQVSDNKENIDKSGTKLIIAKEKKETKQPREENSQKPLDEQSLRQLTKMLKEKLEITKKLNINDETNNSKAASTARPALQALSENLLD